MSSDLGNYRYYIPGPHRSLSKLPVPRLKAEAEAEAETEYVMEGEITRKYIGSSIENELLHGKL